MLSEDVTSTFRVSLMRGILPEVRVAEVYWKDFVDLVREHAVARPDETEREKRRAPSFSCCEYNPPHRMKDNVRRMWAVVLDLDEVYDGRAVRAVLDRWTYVGWTTWSSNSEKPRWRIVLPVRGGLRGEEQLIDAVDHLTKLIKGVKGGKVDRCSKDIAHLWFMPWHPESRHKSFRLWENSGEFYSVPRIIHVDFTDVPSRKPENIGPGERNVALHRFLGDPECLRCKTMGRLLEKAREFNASMPYPLGDKEVRDLVRKKWQWMTTDEHGVKARGLAMKAAVAESLKIDGYDIGGGLKLAATDEPPIPLVGNFLFPGVTLISAKMKEGKSFLVCQLASSIASGEPFLQGLDFPGYSVREPQKCVVIAGEDTPWLINQRYSHNMRSGHLPSFADESVKFVYAEELLALRQKIDSNIPGLAILEGLIKQWYSEGYRVMFFDPLRITEAMLGIGEDQYPGGEYTRSVHTKDLLTTAYFHRLSMRHRDLCILMSLHHGKNKRDHDAQDPGDMVAGTTGLGAGAGATMSILPCPPQFLELQEEGDEPGPKRRELYIHGRVVRETRLLIEQDEHTGLWRSMGLMADTISTMSQTLYLSALYTLGKQTEGGWVTADAIAKYCHVSRRTVAGGLSRARKNGAIYHGKRIMATPHKGFKLA